MFIILTSFFFHLLNEFSYLIIFSKSISIILLNIGINHFLRIRFSISFFLEKISILIYKSFSLSFCNLFRLSFHFEGVKFIKIDCAFNKNSIFRSRMSSFY